MNNRSADTTGSSDSEYGNTHENDSMDFGMFFSANLDLLCIAGTDGKFIRLNRAWEESLGYTGEEVEGRAFMDFIHPDDKMAAEEIFSVLKYRQKTSLTVRIMHKNGTYRYLDWKLLQFGNYIYAAARDITLLKATERMLMDREANFRNFFEAVDDYIVVGNSQGEIVYANTATSIQLGYSQQELAGMHLFDLNEKSKTAEAEQVFRDMIDGRPYCSSFQFEKKDGTVFPVETRVWFGLWNGENSIFSISKDLSAQKAAQDRFYLLFNNNPALMVISNLEDRKIIDVNTAFIEKLGYTREEVIGKTNMELGLFADSSRQKMFAWQLAKDGNIKNVELSVRKKDGTLIDGLFSGDIIDNLTEKSFLTVMMDITDLKKAEAENEKKSGLILSLFESVEDLVFYKNTEGVYLGCNPIFAAYAGIEREDIIGKTDYDLFDRKRADAYTESDRKVLKLRRAINSEEWTAGEDGRMTLVDTMKTPYFDARGNLVGIIGIGRDITERKRREDQIHYLSFHDQLTGLYNRRFYEEERKRLDVARSLPLSIIMCDVNGLKFANDALGHAMGDELLSKAADAIRKCCRAEDIAARIGGDEFVVLLPNTDADEVLRVTRRINDQMYTPKTGGMSVSMSIGCATKTQESENIDDIYQEAEDVMYRNKLRERAALKRDTVDVIMNMLYHRSHGERRHAQRVGDICELLAGLMNLSNKDTAQIRFAGLMHDIGKIGVDEGILNKTGELSSVDWEKIRRHPELGYRILSSVSEFAEIADFVLEHQEKWDGTGYPKGLKGDEISLPARIIAVAEAYDAMTSDQMPGRKMSGRDAAAELKRCAGTQFDPDIVKIFPEDLLLKDN